MGLTATDYRDQLQALTPFGPAWPRDEGAALTALLDGLSQELARVDARALNLVDESDPRLTYEMLTDWERAAGLPDACWILWNGSTTASRRAALVQRLTSVGGQSRAYFIAQAAALGYAGATITEFTPVACGSVCTAPLNTASAGWPWAWRITLPLLTVTVMRCADSCADAIRTWGDDVVECVLQRLRPAHTTLQIAYV